MLYFERFVCLFLFGILIIEGGAFALFVTKWILLTMSKVPRARTFLFLFS